ncbi:MAG: DNA methylase [Candidatus Methanoperedenaceae archaeon GB50]|nr:MAG: DNA methylase [Candidatus Methanoperedenaceae archaeon GB50]
MNKQLTLFEDETKETTNHTAKSYTGIYAMHKYWSKKPYNIIREFILRYTEKGEIVLDPFCGSGISVIESIFTERKAIGVDINPSAIFITKQMINKVPIKLIQKEFSKLESEVKDVINSFYIVKRIDKKFIGTHFIWENGKLTEVWYKNDVKSRTKIIERPTQNDLELALSFSYNKIPYYYPKDRFFHNSRINANRENHIYELFTPRNLMALSLLMDRIEKIENKDIKEFFKFCFTASVGQASRMVFVVKRRGKFNSKSRKTERKEVGSWVIGYWVPKENFEINVWNCFENRYRKILKAKRELEYKKYSINEATNFEELLELKNLLLITEPAQKALKEIPDNSIDYVITDPPHGNRQPYLELSMMWNSWLKKDVNYDDEIVISESKDRKKDIHNYYKLLNEVLDEIERILKPNRYFSLMFNSLDNETWINLLIHTSSLKFDLEKVETLEYSANSVVQDTRRAGLKTDFILIFRKNLNKTIKDIELISVKKNKDYIINVIENYLKNSIEKSLETYQILNLLISELLPQNKFFSLSEILNLLEMDFDKEGSKWTRRGI